MSLRQVYGTEKLSSIYTNCARNKVLTEIIFWNHDWEWLCQYLCPGKPARGMESDIMYSHTSISKECFPVIYGYFVVRNSIGKIQITDIFSACLERSYLLPSSGSYQHSGYVGWQPM